jgi:hypothetical protein
MVSRMTPRCSLIVALLLMAVFATGSSSSAQTKKISARYTGTSANLKPGAGESVRVDVLEWSTEADREKLVAAFKDKGDAGVLETLEAGRTLGFIWTSAAVGHSVRYAHRISLPDGGERVILGTNVRLGRGANWKPVSQAGSSDQAFTVVEIRMGRRGDGEGKLSFTSKLAVEDSEKTIALADYAASPVLISGVKREISAVEAKSQPTAQ